MPLLRCIDITAENLSKTKQNAVDFSTSGY
jgi:hypothetical protein